MPSSSKPTPLAHSVSRLNSNPPRLRKTGKISIAAAVAAVLAGQISGVWTSRAHGAALYWDTNGTTSGSDVDTGTWGSGNLLWNNDPTGGNGGAFTDTTTSSDDLFFSAGSGGLGGTVTVSGSQSANSITFQDTTANSLTISGGTSIILGGGTGASGLFVAAGNNANTTISTAISFASPTETFQTAGTGILNIAGGVTGTAALVLNNNSTGIGGITISGASLNNTGTVTNSGTGTGTTVISSVIGTNVSSVTQNSSTSGLMLSGANTFTGGLNILAGTVTGSTSANAFGANNSTITLGNTSGSAAATLLESTTGLTIANPIVLASGTTGVLTIGNTGAAISTTFSGGVTGANNLTIASNATSGTITFSTTALNNSGTITNTGSGTGTTTISAAVGSNVTGVTEASNSSALTITGGLTVNSGGTTLTSTGTALFTASGGVTGTGALVLNANSTGGITLSGASVNNTGSVTNSGTGTGLTTISSVIGTNVTGGVVENSPTSQLTLGNNANTYTGTTNITSGVLSVGNVVVAAGASGLGNATSAVILGGASTTGILSYTGNSATYTRGFTVNAGGGEVDVTTSGQTLSDSAAQTLGGPLTIGGAGGFTLTTSATVNITGTASTTLTKNGTGTLTLQTTNLASISGAVPIVINSGTLQQNSGTAGGYTNPLGTGTITFNPTATVTPTLGISVNTGTSTYANSAINIDAPATGSGTALISVSGGATFSSPVVLGAGAGAGTATLQLKNVNNASFTLTMSGGFTGTGNLQLNATGNTAPITLSTGTIAIAGGISNIGTNAASTATISAPITTTNLTFLTQAGASPFTVSSNLALTNALNSFTSSGAGLFTLSGAISGSQPLTLNANSTGGITVSTGGVNNAGVVTNSGTGTNTTNISAIIGTNVTGVVQNSATSNLALSGANTFTTGLQILAGTVSGTTSANAFGANASVITLGNSSGSANATLSGGFAGTFANPIAVASGSTGTLTITDTAASIFSGAVTLNNNLSVTATGANALTLSGAISGNGNLSLTASGTGALTLSGSSINPVGLITYTGTGTASSVISGAIGSNVHGLTQNSTTSQLTLSGTNSFTGGASVNAGVLEFQTTASLPGYPNPGSTVATVASGATVALGVGAATGQFTATDVNNIISGTIPMSFTSSGSYLGFDTSLAVGGSFALSSNMSDFTGGPSSGSKLSINKIGTGTLVLTGTSTYSGTTLVSNGVLSAAASSLSANSNLNINSALSLNSNPVATFAPAANFEMPLGTGAGQMQISGGASGFTSTVANLTVDFGSSGTPTALTWGGSTFSPTSLVLNDTSATQSINFLNAINLGTSARTVAVNSTTAGTAATLSGLLSGGSGGVLTKTGAGQLIVTNTGNTFTGGVAGVGGTITFAGAGTLPTSGTISMSTGATIQVLNDGTGSNQTIAQGNQFNIASNSPTATTLFVGNNGSGNTGNTIAFGLLNNQVNSQNVGALNIQGANGYNVSFTGIALPNGTGNDTKLFPTTASVTINGNVTNAGTGSTSNFDTLYFSGTASGNIIAGTISDAATGSITVGNYTRLLLQGSNTLTLTGNSTYTGGTGIGNSAANTGTLIINGSVGGTAVTVNGGGTLGGTGTIGNGIATLQTSQGTVTVAGGTTAAAQGTISLLDNAIGTLTIKGNAATGATNFLTLGSTTAGNYSILNFDVGSNSTDKINILPSTISGSGKMLLQLGGAVINLNQLSGSPLATGTYPLINYATGSTFTGGFTLAPYAAQPGIVYYLNNTATSEQLVVAAGAGANNVFWSGSQSGLWNANPAGTTNFVNAFTGGTTSALPSSDTNVFFTSSSAAANFSTTLGQAFYVNSLSFTGTSSPAATNPITIAGTATTPLQINAAAGFTDENSTNYAAGVGIVVQAGSAAHTISAPVVLGASQAWENDSASALTVSGAVSGAYSLTKTGVGSLILGGANTFSGGLTISGGTVIANVSNASNVSGAAGPSTSTITLGGAGNAASMLANSFTVSNPIILGNSGANTLTVGNNGGATAAVFSGGLNLNGFNVSIAAQGTGSTTVNGGITGTGNVTYTLDPGASATVTSASYVGQTFISSGTVNLNQATASNTFGLLSTGQVNLSGGILKLKDNGTASFQTIMTGNGTTGNNLVVSGSATIDVNNNGANTGNNFVFNNMSIGGNTLSVTGSNSYALTVAGTTSLTGAATFSPTTANLNLLGQFSDGGNGVTFSGTGTTRLLNSASGTGANSISGTLAMNGGVLIGYAAAAGNAGGGSDSLGTAAITLGGTTPLLRLAPSLGATLTNGVTPGLLDKSFTGVASVAATNFLGNVQGVGVASGLASNPTGIQTIANINYVTGTASNTTSHQYTGLINITTPGMYFFSDVTDDGATLNIDGVPVFAVTSNTTATGSVYLTAGLHTFSDRWNNNTGAGAQVMSYQGPDTNNVLSVVPASVFYSANNTADLNATFAQNVTVAAGTSGTIDLASNTTIGAVNFGGTGATLNVTGSNNMTTLTTGAITTNGTSTLAPGTAVLVVPNVTGSAGNNDTLVLGGASNPSTTFSAGNQVSGVIADGASGTLALVKSGVGVWNLTGSSSNTYTGGTVVQNSGAANFYPLILAKSGGATAIPAGSLTIGNVSGGGTGYATVQLGASEQIDNSVVMGFNAASGKFGYFQMLGFSETLAGINDSDSNGVIENMETQVVNTNSTLTLVGTSAYSYNGYMRNSAGSTGTGVLNLVMNGVGGSETLGGANIIYTGTTTISNGSIILNGATAFASPVVFSSGANGTLQFNTATQSIAGLSSLDSAPNNNELVQNLAATSGVLTVAQATNGTFAGILQNNPNQSTPSTLGLTKTGVGTLTLSNASTYTGNTAVNVGGLVVNGSLGGTAVTVAGGASLGGTGTIGDGSATTSTTQGTVTVAGGSTAAAQGTISLLDGTIGTLTIKGNAATGATNFLTLGGAAGSYSVINLDVDNTSTDQITLVPSSVSGSGTMLLNAGGAVINLNQLSGAPLALGTYPLINYASGSTLTGGFTLGANTPAPGLVYYLSGTATAESLNVVAGAGAHNAFWTGSQSSNWNTNPTGTTNFVTSYGGSTSSALPSSDTNVFFTGAATNLSTTLGQGFDINSLSFTGTGTPAANNSVTIAGTGTPLQINAAAGFTDQNNANYAAGIGIVVQSGSGTHTISAPVVLGGNQTWEIDNNGVNALTVSGVVSGAFGLTKTGNGTLILTGANTFAGPLTINGGVVSTSVMNTPGLPQAMGLGSVLNLNGGTFRYTGAGGFGTNTAPFAPTLTIGANGGTMDVTGNYLYYGGVLTGSGTLTVINSTNNTAQNPWLLVVSNNPSFSGNIVIGNGINTNSGIQYRSNAASPFGTGTITVNGGGILTADAGATNPGTVPNNIVMNGGLLGAQGASVTYSGAITLQGGSSIGSPTSTTTGVVTLSGPISGAGNLTKTTADTAILSGANSYTGATIVTGGLLQVNSAASLGGLGRSLTVGSGAVAELNYAADVQTELINDVDGTSSGLVLFGAGTTANNLDLSAATGANQSSVSIGAMSSMTITGTVTPNGTLRLAGGGGTLTLSGTNALTDGSSLAITSSSLTGTIVLAGSNNYSGGTTFGANSALVVNFANGALGSGAIGFTANTTLQWATGNTQDISLGRTVSLTGGTATFDTQGNNVTLANSIGNGGSGSLTKVGTGTLTLNAAETYTGTTTITTGVVQLGNANALRSSLISLGGTNALTFSPSINTFTVGGLTGAGNIALAATDASPVTLQVGYNNAAQTTYTGVLSGAGGFTKLGSQSFSFTTAQTYTGATTVINGPTTSGNGFSQLKLDFSLSTPATNLVSASSPLVLGGSLASNAQTLLGGGNLLLNGKASTTNSQAFNGTTIGVGGDSITLTANATANPLSLNLGTIARSTGGVLEITLPTGTQGTTNGVITTAGTASKILTDGNGTAYAVVGGTDWAARDSSGIQIVGMSVAGAGGGSLYTAASTPGTFTGDADITATFSATSGSTVNSIRFNVGGKTLTLAGVNTITTGGVLFGSGLSTTASTLTGGSIQPGTGGELVFISENQAVPVINSAIQNNGSNPTTVTYRANPSLATTKGEFSLGGTNTYTGNTYVLSGRVDVGSLTSPFGTGNVYIDGNTDGQVFKGGAGTVNNNFFIIGNGWNESSGSYFGALRIETGTIAGNVTLLGDAAIGAQSTAGTVSGVISGGFNLTKVGGSTLVLSAASGNTYSGNTLINAGTLQFNAANDIGGSGASVTIASGTTMALNYAVGQSDLARVTPASAGTFALMNATSANLDFSSSGANLPNVFLGATVNSTYSGTLTPFGTTYRIGGGGATLTLGGTNALTGASNNVIVNGNITLSGSNNYGGGTTVQAGTLTLTAANAIGSGTTTLSGGTVNFANGALGSGAITVANSATLQYGTGNTQDISGQPITLSAGTLTLDTNGNNVTFANGIGNFGAGALTKAGAGTLTLNAASMFTGTTTVNAGTVVLGTSNALYPSAPLVLGNVSGVTVKLAGGNAAFAGISGAGATGGSIDLNGNTLTFGSNNAANTLGGSIANSGSATTAGLVKVGTGTQTFQTTNGTSIAVGSVTVGGGTLLVDYSATTLATNPISSSATLTLGGLPSSGYIGQISGNGVISFKGKSATAVAQTFASTTLNAGANQIVNTLNAATSVTTTLGLVTRNTAALADFNAPANTSINIKNANATTILGGWATANGGAGWATSAGNGTTAGAVTALAAYSSTYGAGGDVDNGTQTAGSGTINSLRFNNAAATAVDLTGGLSVATGGVLITPTVAANAVTLNNGTLSSGGSELFLQDWGTGLLTVNSQITGNPTLVIKTNGGNVTLTNPNNAIGDIYYSGTASNTANKDVLTITANGAAGTGTIHLNGVDGMTVNGGITLNNPISIGSIGANNGGVYANGGAAGTVTLNGAITMTGQYLSNGTFAAAPGYTLVVNGAIAANGWAVNSRIGNTVFSGGGDYASFTNNQDTTSLGANNGLGTHAVLDVANSAAGTVDLKGFNQTLAGLTRIVANSAVVTSTTGASTLTLNVPAPGVQTNGTTTALYTGNYTYAGVVTGNLSVVKTGPGTQTFSGTNSYTGTTTVTGGTLVLSASNNTMGTTTIGGAGTVKVGASNALGDGALTVNSGGTLDANGTANVNIYSLSGTGGTITDSGTTTGTTTLSVASNSNTSFAGSITNGATRNIGLVKAGSGTLTLSGTSNYTGPTNVTSGTVVVSGTLSGTTSTNIASSAFLYANGTVNGAASVSGTLAGSGTVAGPVTANSGGTVVPGNSAIGMLTVNSGLNLNAGSNLSVQLGGAGVLGNASGASSGLYSQVSANGIAVNNSTLQLTLASGYTPQAYDFLVIALNGGSMSGAGFSNVFTDNNLNGNVALNGGQPFAAVWDSTHTYEFALSYHATTTSMAGGQDIALLAVPEPNTAAILLAGLGSLVGIQRFRRRRF